MNNPHAVVRKPSERCLEKNRWFCLEVLHQMDLTWDPQSLNPNDFVALASQPNLM